MDRRNFIKSGTGLAFVISTGLGMQSCWPRKVENPLTINPWIIIRPDDKVIIYNPAAEMGQGSMTALPVIVAEELDVAWKQVEVLDSPIDAEIYGHDGWGSRQMMAIVGSYAVEGYFNTLRMAGAQARLILKHMAADYWQCDPTEVTTSKGTVLNHRTTKKLSYGELTQLGKLPNPLPVVLETDLKSPDHFSIVGKYVPRIDIPSKTNGTAQYSIDVSAPGMVYGVIERAPWQGAQVKSVNKEVILRSQNVIDLVELENGLGIIAETFESALAAKNNLKIEWEGGTEATTYNSADDFAEFEKVLDDTAVGTEVIKKQDDLTSRSKVVRRYMAEFFNEYAYHAQMEPLNAVVTPATGTRPAQVWIGTQAPDSMLSHAAAAFGLDENNVHINRCLLGGGFGRRTRRDYMLEAIALAQHTGRPTKLIWTREDDVKSGTFRPATLQRIEAGVDRDGNICTWKYEVTGPGKGLISTGSDIPHYAITDQSITAKYMDRPVLTNSWRAEGHFNNKFAIESMVDMVATREGKDPATLRRHLLRNDQRALDVLDKVLAISNWYSAAIPGRARGLSFCERSAITACVCEMSLDSKRGIRVHKVWIALDTGMVVQPDNARAQVEGAVIMGISSALYEGVTLTHGSIDQSNFHNYRILRCEEAPESIEVEFIKSNEKPVGIGEAGVPAIGGAIANAFASLTGKRMFHMPFTVERINEALA